MYRVVPCYYAGNSTKFFNITVPFLILFLYLRQRLLERKLGDFSSSSYLRLAVGQQNGIHYDNKLHS